MQINDNQHMPDCDIVISVYSTKVNFWECEKKMGVKKGLS